jgi:hypothetical protein
MEISPVCAAVLVDDQRHVGAGGLHPHQQVDRRHGRRHEQDRPLDTGRRERRRQVDLAEVQPARAGAPRAGAGRGAAGRVRRAVDRDLDRLRDGGARCAGPARPLAAMWSTRSRMWTMPRGSSRVSP